MNCQKETKELSLGPSALIPFMGALPSWLFHLPKVPPPDLGGQGILGRTQFKPQEYSTRKFPGGLVVRTSVVIFHCQWLRFNPWLGNWHYTCCKAPPKKKKNKKPPKTIHAIIWNEIYKYIFKASIYKILQYSGKFSNYKLVNPDYLLLYLKRQS